MSLHESLLLRRALLPFLARFNPGDITIRHPYTGDPLRLHSYHHKGYWLLGRRREAEAMALLARVTPPGGTVLDVGAHIGFLSQYFASLVGPQGRVFAFEPGPNNLPYLRRNARARPNVTVVPRGAGDSEGERVFYTETLTGQNNSFVHDFDIFEKYRKMAFDPRIRVKEERVEMVTLDGFTGREGIHPDLIKIDVEGFEEPVLRGARAVLERDRPLLMVEIQSRKQQALALLSELGYRFFNPRLAPVSRPEELEVNTFCFHRERHADLLRGLS